MAEAATEPAALGIVQKPQRWDVPFWQEITGKRACKPMTEKVVADILEREPFLSLIHI